MITLKPHQAEEVERAFPHDGYGLFYEQRTGKTFISLELSKRWNCHKNLVICPKKGIPVWQQAIKEYGLDSKDFTIVGYESYRAKWQNYQNRWDLVIVDESHRIKERGSLQTQRIWKLSRKSRKRLILTGTPQGQGMEDYYGQLKFIRPDLFPSWKAFSEQYLVIEMVTYPGRDEDPFPKIVGYKNQSHFQQILKTISSRRTRDEVANTVTISRNIREIVAPSEAFLTHYRALETELYTLVSTGMVSAANALVKASKLHQVCGGFVKDDDGEVHQVNQDKLDHLWKLIDRALPEESFVVVANYKAEMTAISEGLTARGISNKQIRGGKAHQYDPHDRSRVTILNPSAGEAINLSHHDHMIIFSMNFSFLKWSQFKDRIVLLDKPQVKYYYILMKETIDELVYKAVLEKKKMSDEILRVFSTSS